MRMLFAPAVSKKDKEKERLAKEAAARPKTPEEEIMDSQEAYNDAKRQEDLGKPLSLTPALEPSRPRLRACPLSPARLPT